MKYEWRKSERHIYLPKASPELIDVSAYQYIVIRGEGNPNSPFFSECIGVLYSLSYAIKMHLKKLNSPPAGYTDYTVYPLEGVWDITEEAKQHFTGTINKDELVFDLMIRQPQFVSKAFFDEMLEFTAKKKPHPLLNNVQFITIEEWKCIQMLHVGSYDDEPATFKQMEAFAIQQHLQRASKKHREIYLSDFRKVPVEKLRTVLRFQVSN